MRLKNRHTGVVKEFNPDIAAELLKGGIWVDPGTASNVQGEIVKAKKAAYSTTGQKFITGAEGLLEGVSGGIAKVTGEDADARREYHPGISLAGNIVGAIMPGGVGSLTAKGAKALVGATKLGKVAPALATGAELAVDVAAQNTISSVSTAIREGSSIGDALTSGMRPTEVLAIGVGGAVGSKIAGRLRNRAAALREEADIVAKHGKGLEDAQAAGTVAQENLTKAQEGARVAEDSLRKYDDFLPDHAYQPLRRAGDEARVLADDFVGQTKRITQEVDDLRNLNNGAELKARAWEQRKRAWDLGEAERVAKLASPDLSLDEGRQVFEASRAQAQEAFKKELGDLATPDQFDDWLKQRNLGHLTEEGYQQGNLADLLMDHIAKRGEGLPTNLRELQDELVGVAESYGYRFKGPAAKKARGVTDKLDNMYEGFLPEEGLRALQPDEATKVFTLDGAQIGSASKAAMKLTAEEARQLSPGRLMKLMEKMDEGERAAFTKTLSPTARASLALFDGGVIQHLDSPTLQKHLLRAGPYSERGNRLRAELKANLGDVFEANGDALVRPGLHTGIEPTYTGPARPYPQPPTKMDLQEALSRMETTMKDTQENLAALKALKLPTSPKGFLRMGDVEFDRLNFAAKKARKSSNPAVRQVAESMDRELTSVMDRYGVDVTKHLQNHNGDAFDAFKTLRQDLRLDQYAASRELSLNRANAKIAKQEMAQAAKDMRVSEKLLGDAGVRESQSLAKSGVGLFSRFMGAKLGILATGGGNGLAQAVGFAAGSTAGRMATNKVFGATTKRLTSEALLAKAARAERIANTMDHLTENWLHLMSADRPKLQGKWLESLLGVSTKDSFANLMPSDYDAEGKTAKQVLKDAIAELGTALEDPHSAAYKAVSAHIQENPGLAKDLNDSITRKFLAIREALPAPLYQGSPLARQRAVIALSESDLRLAAEKLDTLQFPDEVVSEMVKYNYFPAHRVKMIRKAHPELYGEYAMRLADFYHSPLNAKGDTRYNKLSLSHRMQVDTFLNQDTGSGVGPSYTAFTQGLHNQAQGGTNDAQNALVPGQTPATLGGPQAFNPGQVDTKSPMTQTATGFQSSANRFGK